MTLHSRWRIHLIVALLSLTLNLQLRWADQLGIYQDDFNKAAAALHGERALTRSPGNLIHFFFTDEPLFNVTQSLRFWLLGLEPAWAHHVLQGLLGAANATLAFSLVWRLAGSYLPALLFFLMFVTYPGLGEAQFWPAAPYVPMLFCFLLALHFFWSWLAGGRRVHFVAAWLFYSAAIFTHEAAFGLLGVVAAMWWLRVSQDPRHKAAIWREGARSLLPFLAANLGYLIFRQTAWFGLGDPGFLHQRPLSVNGFFQRLMESVRLNFGDWSAIRTRDLLTDAWAPQTALFWLASFLGVAILFLLWLGPGRVGRRWRFEGFAGFLVLILGFSLVTSTSPPGVYHTMRVALYVAAGLALLAWLRARLHPLPSTGRVQMLAVFGLFWFFCAFAPTYVYYFSSRHNYIPAIGSSLVIAVGLWLPSAVVPARRLRRFAQGGALALATILAFANYGAGLGEVQRWAEAHAFITRLRSQLLALHPDPRPGSAVIILDLPDYRRGVPMLSQWGLYSAVQLWYDEPTLQADSAFVPHSEGFTLAIDPTAKPQDYARLVLYGYENEVLEKKGRLRFPDGVEIVLGAGEGMNRRAAPPLPITVGKMVRNSRPAEGAALNSAVKQLQQGVASVEP